MGRRFVSVVGSVLVLGVLGGCSSGERHDLTAGVPTYPHRFAVPDPELDAESTAADLAKPPNVDLVGISADVGYDGVRARFRYARSWLPRSSSRWGIRFELRGSDGSRLSGGWTHDPDSGDLPRVRLAPTPAGCAASVHWAPGPRELTLALTPGCLPDVSASRPRPWIRFDTLEAVTSWHRGEQILYGWDALYSRVVAPEPARLYLPRPD